MIKKLVYLLMLSFLGACAIQRPIEKISPENNRSYDVEYLFEHDGCKVYRFKDQGNYIYFTNCGGDVTHIENDSIQHRVFSSSNKIKFKQ